ncbi:MAG: DUF4203 domain-containing protein [Clostridia bacterium]|nr:DUF4203 domain-containing protein [Clostridia bacterium]
MELFSTFSLDTIIQFIQSKVAENETASAFANYLTTHTLLVMLIVTLVGFLFVFFGYKFFRFLIALAGFAAGMALGYLLTSKLLTQLSANVTLIIILVLGLVGAVIAFKIYKLGVFLGCAWLAYKFLAPLFDVTIAQWITDNTGVTISAFVISIVIAIIAGVLGLLMQKPVIIVCSCVGGAFIALKYGLDFLVSASVIEAVTIHPTVELVIVLVLAALGLLFQFGLFRKKKES